MVEPYLLDVNVLIGLIDQEHIHHRRAMRWFMANASEWLSCPVTQNGAIRIMSRPGYASPSFGAQYVGSLIESLIRNTNHRFIPEDFSILDGSLIDLHSIHSHDRVTDTYLLALARRHNAKLATMDMKLSVAAVPDGERYLWQIP